MSEKNKHFLDNVHYNYLMDLGFLVREMSFEAKKRSVEGNTDFELGYLSGFHRFVSLMQQQAEAFGIPLESINLDGIDPDIDLI